MEGTLGEVRLFAGNFAPRGWAFCDGSPLPIASNPALFSLLGTTYGGDGRSTFALPDLRSRAALGVGDPPGLPKTELGEVGDLDTETGDAGAGTLGLTYIICVSGLHPARH